MTKLYIPYDYKVIMKGYYEISTDNELYTLEKLRDGSLRPESGIKLDAEVLMEYDHKTYTKDFIKESDYNEEIQLKKADTSGFTVNGK